MKRIPITENDLEVVAGPSYQEQTEDGPQSRYDYFLVYHNRQPDALTLDKVFTQSTKAELMRQWVVKHGSLNPERWDKGDPWSHIHRGMSLQERYAPYGPAWQAEQQERR